MSPQGYPTKPVATLGTQVKARTAGWDDIQANDYVSSYEQGYDVLPEGEGVPEFVEGPLEGFYVKDMNYFKHVVDGYDVDPDSIEVIDHSKSQSITAAGNSNFLQSSNRKLLDIDRDIRSRLHQAMNDHMSRALERTGAKIRTKMSRTADGRQWLESNTCNNVMLTRIVNPALIAAHGLEQRLLIEAAWEEIGFLWNELITTGDTALLREIAHMTGIDINTLQSQYSHQLQEAQEAGWEYVQQRLTEIATDHLMKVYFVDGEDVLDAGANLVDQEIARRAIAHAGGAATDSKSAGLLVGDDHSIGVVPQLSSGPIAQEALSKGGLEIESYTWHHGFTPSPFLPHLALDGVEFENWTDDVLVNDEGWPGFDHYIPGDHAGCSCDWSVNWAQSSTTLGPQPGETSYVDAQEFQNSAQEHAVDKIDARTKASKTWWQYQYSFDDPYTGIPGYGAQNRLLRDPVDSKAKRDLQKTWGQVFDRHGVETDDDYVFYRGILNNAPTFEVGKEYIDNGVMSTTASRGAARGWLTDYFRDRIAAPDSAILELRTPKGVRVVGGQTGTFETMMKPGTKIRVLEVGKRPSPGEYAGEMNYVVAEVIK